MKNVSLLCFLFLFMISTSACANAQEPKVTVKAEVTKLNQEQFKGIGTNGLDHPDRNDFRRFSFEVKLDHAPKETRHIDFPQSIKWKQTINSVDHTDRYWFGKQDEQNNPGEDFTANHCEFTFYSKGLSDAQIKDAFNSIMIRASWANEGKDAFDQDYKVSDFIHMDDAEQDSPLK